MKSLVNDKRNNQILDVHLASLHIGSNSFDFAFIPSQLHASLLNTIMLRTTLRAATLRPRQQTVRLSSTTSNSSPSQAKIETPEQKEVQGEEKPAPKKKTMAELDEELRLKMSGLAGDGGEAGVELEGGQVRSINRNVFPGSEC